MAGAYAHLASEGSTASALGSAFISLVEPHPGHEHAYNRWYEDDHFYSPGAMAMPWWFAGRRWVATRDLKALRVPDDSPVVRPVTSGCYLGTYWITADHWRDQWEWLSAAVSRLRDEGRMFEERTHVHTAFYDVRASVRRDDAGPRDFQALDHPFGGLVLEIIDAASGDAGALQDWLVNEHLPRALADSPAALCILFAPHPWPAGDLWFDNADVPGDRFALLWFLEVDPRACWSTTFEAEADRVAAGCAGHARLIAPFIPTVPGTDRYVDELR